MADRLVRVPLWDVTAIASTATLTSPPIPLSRADFESILYKATSVAGTADVKIEYAISEDGTNFGSFDDNTDLVASSNAVPTAEGLKTIPGVTVAAPWMKIKVTGTASNNADTLFTGVVYLRETPDGQTS
jgi:hypothetical protein